MAMKINSPYTAAITGGGFLLNETLALLPLLQSEDREELLKDERLNNRVLMINAETSRKKAILEISRRYDHDVTCFLAGLFSDDCRRAAYCSLFCDVEDVQNTF